jgi:hypothetical protein
MLVTGPGFAKEVCSRLRAEAHVGGGPQGDSASGRAVAPVHSVQSPQRFDGFPSATCTTNSIATARYYAGSGTLWPSTRYFALARVRPTRTRPLGARPNHECRRVGSRPALVASNVFVCDTCHSAATNGYIEERQAGRPGKRGPSSAPCPQSRSRAEVVPLLRDQQAGQDASLQALWDLRNGI